MKRVIYSLSETTPFQVCKRPVSLTQRILSKFMQLKQKSHFIKIDSRPNKMEESRPGKG